jgi:cytochrome bd ubiquinol oxidase subunit II
VNLADLVALVLWLGVSAYAVLGGADFGSGFWDLTAGGARRGARPRALVDLAIGSVWEANHVWLIFCLVVLWTAFPPAFVAIMTTLFVPLMIAVIGIVLRGSGFAFRHVTREFGARRAFGVAFAVSSIVTPFAMGAIAGAIASGRVPLDGSGDQVTSWLNPTSIFAGVLAVATCSFLAATFLVDEARHRDEAGLIEYFRRRGIGAGIATGVLSLVGIVVLRGDAEWLFDRLVGRALPLLVLSGIGGIGAMWALHRSRPALARGLAVVAVGAVVWGWGVAQYDYLLPTTLTIDEAAAPSGTMWALVGVVVLAVLIVVPALWLLLSLSQQNRLETEDLSEVAAENVPHGR